MTIVLDHTQELIERSFYEAARLACVFLGYTPDITTYPNTPAGTAQYKADLALIKDSKGFAIELFNQGNPDDKGYKKYPRIVFITESYVQGEFGISQEDYLIPSSPGFKRANETQAISHQLFLNCWIIADTTTQMRTLFSIITATLPLLGYLPHWDDPSQSFFIENTDTVDTSSAKDGIQEKVFKFRVPDIIWTAPTNSIEIIPELNQINLNLEISSHLGIDIWIPSN